MNEWKAGIDLGGTKIYSVITDSENKILARAKISTPENASAKELACAMAATAEKALETLGGSWKDVKSLGAALPSPVDPTTGEAVFATNLAEKNFSLREYLKELTRKDSVYLENDANMGLYGEYVSGCARGAASAVGFWVGTGLGGSILLDGKILQGSHGLAGELGHMIVKEGGRKCGCGHKGCLEAYCSKKAFIKSIRKYMDHYEYSTLLPEEKFNSSTRNIKSRYLLRAYEEGDQAVKNAVDKGAWFLGIAAANMCQIISPEVIVLGGGVITSLEKHFLPIFLKSFSLHHFTGKKEFVRIFPAANGDDSVALGAAIFAGKGGKF